MAESALENQRRRGFAELAVAVRCAVHGERVAALALDIILVLVVVIVLIIGRIIVSIIAAASASASASARSTRIEC